MPGRIELKTIIKFLVIVSAGAAMLRISWLSWPDILVDFGREVYVPWQLSQGSVLYRDIGFFYGPLSAYWNSALFSIFGTSIFVLEITNIILIAGLTFLIYKLFEDRDDELAPAACCVIFLALFAFPRYFPDMGSYNFVAPYSHELVHGTILAFLAIYLLKLYLRSSKLRWIASAGFCTGLVLLTKMEVALSISLALFAGLAAIVFCNRPSRGHLVRLFALFGGGLAIPTLAFTSFFTIHMSAAEAFRSIFSSWIIVATQDIGSSKFYMASMGTDDIAGNLTMMSTATSWYLILLLPLFISFFWRSNETLRKYAGGASLVISAGALAYLFDTIPWYSLLRPLPLFMALIIPVLAAALIWGTQEKEIRNRLIIALVMAVFALGMLLKIILNVRVTGYGFVLAMPAALMLAWLLMSLIPAALKGTSGGAIFRYSVLGAVIVMLAWHLNKTTMYYTAMGYAVGRGEDKILTYKTAQSEATNIALEEIDRIMKPGDDFVVIPEGILINYLSRRPNPSGFVTLLPSDIQIFGEDKILASLEKSPPRYVIFTSRDSSEYGFHYIGQDYGFKIFSFIMDRYKPVGQIGSAGFLRKSVSMNQPAGIIIFKLI